MSVSLSNESEHAKVKRILGGSLKYEFGSWAGQWAPIAQRLNSEAPVVLEIGFAKGLFLINTAKANPNTQFIGIEIRKKWADHVKGVIAEEGLKNVAVCRADAQYILSHFVDDNRLQEVHVLFPDPWWKERHQRRRLLLTPEFLSKIAKVLKPGGLLNIRTDVVRYAQQVIANSEEVPQLARLDPAIASGCLGTDCGFPSHREIKCRKDGLLITRIVFQKKS